MKTNFIQKKDSTFVYWGTVHTVMTINDLFGRMEIYGWQNIPKTPCIIVSNHVSFFDPPSMGLFWESNRISVLARGSLSDNKLMALYLKCLNAIALKRGGQNDIGAIKESLNRIKGNSPIVIFPEGTRSDDGTLQRGKAGAAMIALKANVPILPIRTFGFEKVLPKSNKLAGGARISFVVGKPVMPSDLDPGKSCEDRMQVMADNIMNLIAQLKEPTLNEV